MTYIDTVYKLPTVVNPITDTKKTNVPVFNEYLFFGKYIDESGNVIEQQPFYYLFSFNAGTSSKTQTFSKLGYNIFITNVKMMDFLAHFVMTGLQVSYLKDPVVFLPAYYWTDSEKNVDFQIPIKFKDTFALTMEDYLIMDSGFRYYQVYGYLMKY